MLLRCQRPLPSPPTARSTPKPNNLAPPLTPLSKPTHHVTRNRHQLRIIQRMAEVHNAIPIARVRRPLLIQRKHHPVHRRLQQPIRPIAEQVTDINQDRRERKVLLPVARRVHGDRRPGSPRRQDLEPRLPGSLEEQRDAPVVGVCAGAHVLGVLVAGGGGREYRRVVEVAQDRARVALRWVVARGEEVGVGLLVLVRCLLDSGGRGVGVPRGLGRGGLGSGCWFCCRGWRSGRLRLRGVLGMAAVVVGLCRCGIRRSSWLWWLLGRWQVDVDHVSPCVWEVYSTYSLKSPVCTSSILVCRMDSRGHTR